MIRRLAVVLLFAGCATLVPGRDYRIDPALRAIIARNEIVSANLCLQRHVIISPRNVSAGTPLPVACYDPTDDVIVIYEHAPAWLWEHELAHRAGMTHG